MPKSAAGADKSGRWARKSSNRNYPSRRLRNKLKRTFQSCGVAFAEAWAAKYGVTTQFLKMKSRWASKVTQVLE